METRRMTIGRLGEDIASSFLERRRVTILDRNVRVGRGEIDLLVSIEGERVAVEVKTAFGSSVLPEENFTEAKQRHVRLAARNLAPPVWRIDLVTVLLTRTGATVRWMPDIG